MSAHLEDGIGRRSERAVQDWLVKKVAAVTSVSPHEVDVDRVMSDYQINSSVLVTLTTELSDWLGQSLPVTVFWEHPSIREVAKAVSLGSSVQ